MVDDQSDNKIYHFTVYGNKTTVNVKPRAHVRKCFPATLISLVVINIDCPQHQEDINIFRMFVKTSEEYYEADKALHLLSTGSRQGVFDSYSFHREIGYDG